MNAENISLGEVFEMNIFNTLFLLKNIYEIYFIIEIYTLLIKYTNVQ